MASVAELDELHAGSQFEKLADALDALLAEDAANTEALWRKARSNFDLAGLRPDDQACFLQWLLVACHC